MAKDFEHWESPLEKIFKPYIDIQAVIKRINQPYKDIHIRLREAGGVGKVGSLLAQRQQDFSMPALTTPAVVEGLPVPSRLAKPLYLPPQLFAGSAFRESTEPFIKPRILIDRIMNRSFTYSLPSATPYVIDLQSLNRSLTGLLPNFSAGSAFQEVTNSIRKIHRILLLLEVTIKLAHLGWFLSRRILQDIPKDLLEMLRSTDSANIERIIGGYFRKKLDIIANELIDNYSPRGRVLLDKIDKIFQSHRQCEYYFSIPLFLIHADRISWLKFGESVFMKRGRENIIARYSLSFHEKFLLSDNSLPIWASQSNRSNDSFILNRHQILHGEIVNYEDEINSLKTISFLYWIHCLA